MAHTPRILRSIAVTWLLCQATTLAFVPAKLWFGPADASVAQCTCPHGADATCPMHQKASASSAICLIRSAATSPAATLGALLGVVALLSRPTATSVPASAPSGVVFERSATTERPARPDPPPPRT